MKKILIIDDEVAICTILSKFLNKNGYKTDIATCGKQGIKMLKEDQYDLLLCDYNLGDIYGSDVLEQIKKTSMKIIVIFISGYGNINTAVNLMKDGAYHYLTKPLYPDLILETIEKAFLEDEDKDNIKEPQPSPEYKEEYVFGESQAAKHLFQHLDLVAPTDYSVIIQGDTGTGKEAIARLLHDRSNRKNQPFIAIDCGSLSKELSASELFGHEKGSFTGAINNKEGAFLMANGGTLFLDEIGNLSYEIQMYLLRTIQEKLIRKVGSTHEKEVDVRIIAATNEDLLDQVKEKNFREDLYHRLNEFKIKVPSLRERREDLEPLISTFIKEVSIHLGKNIKGLDKEVSQLFYAYSWPGNIRELKNVIKRACLLTPDNEYISKDSLPLEMTADFTDKTIEANSLKDITLQAEKNEILKVLKEVNFNKSKAAAILNIDRKTLYNKLREFGEI